MFQVAFAFRRTSCIAVAVFVAMWLAPCIARSQDESVESRIEHVAGLTASEVRKLLEDLKKRTASRNARATCALVIYPLRITGGTIKTIAECEAGFDHIFNTKVTAAIKSQRFEQLFVNWQGVMVGSGEVWISGVCPDKACRTHSLGIINVNN